LVPASTTQLSPTAWRRIPAINPIRVFLCECTVMQGPTINRTNLLSLDPKGPFSTPLKTPLSTPYRFPFCPASLKPPKKRENTSIYFPQVRSPAHSRQLMSLFNETRSHCHPQNVPQFPEEAITSLTLLGSTSHVLPESFQAPRSLCNMLYHLSITQLPLAIKMCAIAHDSSRSKPKFPKRQH
jgi:hypothetical protein